MVEVRRLGSLAFMLVLGCAPPPVGADPETSSESTGGDAAQPCEPGEVQVLEITDICQSYCTTLPASCGEAPSCDPACNWDLCQTVDCSGEVTELCSLLEPETGWACVRGFGPCNPWLDECPRDEQCVPFTGSPAVEWWTGARCAAPQTAKVGEPCSRLEGPYDGIDTCAGGAVCWDVDPDTQLGTCIPLCTGAPHQPSCPLGSRCALADPMWAAFCLPPCDPFVNGCSSGYACSVVGDTFACMPAASDVAAQGQPCEHPNECATGLACVGAEQLPGCAGDRCCTGFCDLDAPACSPGSICTSALGDPPDGFAHVGVCVPS